MSKSIDKNQEQSEDDYYWEDGLMVMTESYHLKRGICCGSGCRHCPFEDTDVQNNEVV